MRPSRYPACPAKKLLARFPLKRSWRENQGKWKAEEQQSKVQRPFNWSPALGQERACYTAGQKQLAQIGTRTRKHLAQTSREHLQWYFRSRRPFDVSAEKVGIYREEELSTSLSLPQSSHGRRLLFVSGSPPAKPTPPYLPRATRVGELREGGIGVGVPIELPPSRPTVFTLPPNPPPTLADRVKFCCIRTELLAGEGVCLFCPPPPPPPALLHHPNIASFVRRPSPLTRCQPVLKVRTPQRLGPWG